MAPKRTPSTPDAKIIADATPLGIGKSATRTSSSPNRPSAIRTTSATRADFEYDRDR